MKKLLHVLSFATLLSALALMLFVIVTASWPYNPVSLQKVEVSPKTVRCGQEVTVHLEFIKNMQIKPEIMWYYVDTYVIRLNDEGAGRPVGKNIVDHSLLLPCIGQPGKRKILVNLRYTVYPWRKIDYSWETPLFMVTN